MPIYFFMLCTGLMGIVKNGKYTKRHNWRIRNCCRLIINKAEVCNESNIILFSTFFLQTSVLQSRISLSHRKLSAWKMFFCSKSGHLCSLKRSGSSDAWQQIPNSPLRTPSEVQRAHFPPSAARATGWLPHKLHAKVSSGMLSSLLWDESSLLL